MAITDSRLIGRDGDDVLFWYKDYRDGGRRKICRLPAVEFIRRFLQHVLPRGFRHIRHFGFLSANQRRQRLPEIRRLLGAPAQEEEPQSGVAEDADDSGGDDDQDASDSPCPVCQVGRMVRGPETPRPTIARLLAIPRREFYQALARQQFF